MKALEKAWEETALDRERLSYVGLCALATSLVPIWVVVDKYLQPEFLRPFFWLRAVDTLAGVALLGLILKSKSARLNRIWVSLKFVLTGAMITVMVAAIHNHYAEYIFGFSLVFWAIGVGYSGPTRYQVAVYGTLFVSWFVAVEVIGRRQPTVVILGAAFYIGSAAVISTITSSVQRRWRWRAFASAHQLGLKNQELAATLATLRDAQARMVASEKQAALGRLLASLSHEINNPMNVIKNNLEPMEAHLKCLDEVLSAARHGDRNLDELWAARDLDYVRGDFADALATVRTAVKRIGTVHGDLRAFVRGDAPAFTEGDLNEGLRATVAMFSRILPDGVKLEARYGELPRLKFQPGQLNQVFFNLIQNAADAVGSGGNIVVETQAIAGEVVIAVVDDGPGVSEPARARLFEPFFTTKDVGKGTGLGLATSYQIVEHHGGRIELDEHHEKGARFVVRLPARALK